MIHHSVAVVSTVLNERAGLRALLDGFLAQTRRPDEIVVVDGGSNDGTQDILREYERAHPGVVVVVVAPGVNIARGRNIAIAHAKSDLIAVTDGGCRPEPDWLEHLVRPLEADAAYGAVTGARRIVGANRFEEFAGVLSTSVNAPDEAERTFHGRNSAFRKSVWAEVGGYPEWLYTAEDTLFARRAKALGCRVALAEDAVVSWRPRPNMRKLCKQYYLYGRGTGRIGAADLRTMRYHLRNHALWLLPLALAPLYPWLLLVTLAMLVYLYLNLVRPVLAGVRERTAAPGAGWYVPPIVMARSLCNNVGQLVGWWEYRHGKGFRANLDSYLAGRWRMESGA